MWRLRLASGPNLEFIMKYRTLIGATLAMLISVAQAQPEITISKDQYVENQLKMMEQIKEVQSDVADSNEKMLKEKLPPGEYEQYKKDQDQAQKDEEAKVANCLGVPVEKMPELSEKVGPEFQISVIKTCADTLPETINLSETDWTINPKFADYKKCAEDLVAKEVGISSAKLQECSETVEDL